MVCRNVSTYISTEKSFSGRNLDKSKPRIREHCKWFLFILWLKPSKTFSSFYFSNFKRSDECWNQTRKIKICSTFVPLTDFVASTFFEGGIVLRLNILHYAMRQLLQPLKSSSIRGFPVLFSKRLWFDNSRLVILLWCLKNNGIPFLRHSYLRFRFLTI